MMTINATNAAAVQRAALKTDKAYPKRFNAQRNAIATIGPHAREGFEFVTTKCDGGWRWRLTDEVRPDTDMQAKINGGKRPARMPVPPRRTGPAATNAPADLATDLIGTPAEKLALDLTAAQKMMLDDGAPAALLRGPDTEEDKMKRAKVVANAAKPKIKNPPDAKKAKFVGTKTSKMALIGQMLLDPKGCTTADVLKKTGWPAVSMPAQAKAVGMKLRKMKEGKITRYFGMSK